MGLLNVNFKGLPKPAADETLASWLFRCAVNRRSRVGQRLQLELRPKTWWVGAELKTADADTDFETAHKKLREAGYDINSAILERFFAPQGDRFVDWSFRRFFCADCLRQDVANGRLPIWRKSWCYEYASICISHSMRLDSLDDSSRYSKAWDAFVQHCNSNANRSPKNSILFARQLASTLGRVARVIEMYPEGNHSILAELFRKLICIFLQAPYRGTHGGAARVHFQVGRGAQFAAPNSLLESFTMGPATADSSSRIGGMVLAASLLGIIPESRFLGFLESYEAMNMNSMLPRDLHRAAAFPQVDRVGYGVLHAYLGYIPRSMFPILDRHLYLQELRYKHEGVCDGRLLGMTEGVGVS